jgi:galactokinase
MSGPPIEMARLGQRAESAVGVEVGLMDPLVVAGARAGHGLLVDFATLAVQPVPIPEDLAVVIVHSGRSRQLTDGRYGRRRDECTAAGRLLGRPLGQADRSDLAILADPLLRRRARHVTTECGRVRRFAEALRTGDRAEAGRLMVDSHRSLALDFEVSTPEVDALVEDLCRRPGVHGARMTGGGFGGCVVALAEPGALDPAEWSTGAWTVRPSGGVTRQVLAGR